MNASLMLVNTVCIDNSEDGTQLERNDLTHIDTTLNCKSLQRQSLEKLQKKTALYLIYRQYATWFSF